MRLSTGFPVTVAASVLLAFGGELQAKPEDKAQAPAETFESVYQQGQALYEQGKYPEATAAFQRALSLMSSAPQAVDPQARAPQARPAANANTEADTFESAYQQGQVLYEQGRYAEATEAFQRALQLQPANEDAARLLVKAKERVVQGPEAPALSDKEPETVQRSQATYWTTQIDKVKANLQAKQDEVGHLSKALAERDQQLQQASRERDRLAARVSEFDGKLQGIQGDNQNLLKERESLRLMVEDLEQRLLRLQNESAQTKGQWGSELEHARRLLAQREAELMMAKQMETRLQERTEQLRTRDLQIAQLHEQLGNLERGHTALKSEADVLRANMSPVAAEFERVKKAYADDREALQQLTADYDQLQGERNQLKDSLQLSQKSQERLTDELTSARAAVSQAEEQLASLKHDLAERQQVTLLTQGSLGKAQQELTKTTQELKVLQSTMSGLHQQLADTTEDLTTTRMNLTSQEAQAQEARQALQQQQQQLIAVTAARDFAQQQLASLQQQHGQGQAQAQQQLEALSKELVTAKDAQRQANEQLQYVRDLNAQLTKTKDQQSALAAELGERVRSVTKENKTLNGERAQLKQSNEKLQSQLQLAQEEAAQVRKQSGEELGHVQQLLKSREAELKAALEQTGQAQASATQLERQRAVLEERLSERGDQLTQRATELTKLQDELHELEQALQQRDTNLSNLTSELQISRKQLEQLPALQQQAQIDAAQREQLTVKVAELTAQLQSTRNQHQHATEQVEALGKAHREAEDRLRVAQAQSTDAQARISRELEEANRSLAGRDAELASANKQLLQLPDLKRQLDEASEEREQQNMKIAELTAQLQSGRKDQQSATAQIEALRKSNRDLEERLRLAQTDFSQAQARWSRELEQANRTLATRDAELAKATKELQQAQGDSSTIKQQYAVLEHRLAERAGEVERLESNVSGLTASLQQAHADLATTKQQLATVNERLNDRTQQSTVQQADLTQLQQQLREIERTYAVSKTEGDQMRESISSKEEELRKLSMTLAQDQQALRDATQRLNESELQRKHTDEQIRVAKETQGALEEELKSSRLQAVRLQDQLVAVQSDRDRFRGGIDQRETQLGQLQAELSNARRELAGAQAEAKQLELGSAEREQQLIVDREGYKWHVDRLQRELERAQAAYRQLASEREQQLNAISARTVSKEDYERVQEAITDSRNQIARLNAEAGERDRMIAQLRADLAQRERDLKASQQAVAKAQEMLQIPTVPLAPKMAPLPSVGPRAAVSSSGAEVKIYRANAEHNFVVISLEGLGDPKTGDTIVLYVNNQPAAEVQLGDIDHDGMAVAYIKRKMDPGVSFRQGDVVVARHFVQPEE